MKNVSCPTNRKYFSVMNKKNAAGGKKIISQRQQFTFYSLCVEGTCRGFIYSPVSVRFFFQLSSFSCDFLFVRFLSRPRSDFRLLLINCYFYDFMLTRKRDIIVINVQSSWISCSSMKFLSISRFYDFWCMRYERLPLTSSFLFFLCLLFSVCVLLLALRPSLLLFDFSVADTFAP